jgi:hypothetical protein
MAAFRRVAWSERRKQVAARLERCEREGVSLRKSAQRAGLPVARVYGWRQRLLAERGAGTGGGTSVNAA